MTVHIVEELGLYYGRASVRDVGGPTRVVTDDPDPTFKPRPVGFTAALEPIEREPQVWDGDNG